MLSRSSRAPPQLPGLSGWHLLGRGGMGEVALARKVGAEGFERWVAVKLVRPDLAANLDVRAMFRDEAVLLSRIEHPAIARAEDFGESEGSFYLVLEYVHGLTLDKLRARLREPVPPPTVARMVAEVARGLQAVHELAGPDGQPLGIVHRDISPHNIMMSFHGRMKLIDFGIALSEARTAKSTSTGLLKGKIAYVAPEQLTGATADRRTDIYALGIVAHELLTGVPLFQARSSPLAAAEDRKRPPKPSKVVTVPRRLERVVMKALSSDPDERWQSARDFAEALEEAAGRGESLEGFAERELGKAHAEHEAWLEGLAAAHEDSEEIEIEEVAPSMILESAPTPRRAGGFWRAFAASAVVASLALAVFGTAQGRSAARAAGASVSSWVEGLHPSAETLDSEADEGLAPSSMASATGSRESKEEAVAFEQRESGESAEAAVSSGITRSGESAEAAANPGITQSGESAGRAANSVIARSGESAEAAASSGNTRSGESAEAAASSGITPSGESGGAEADAAEMDESSAPDERVRGWGRMSILARSGGWVSIDGEPFGRTPLKSARVRAGAHEVELRRSGDRSPRWTSRVRIHDGKHLRIRLR